jgi:hypothetical protein
MKIWQNVQAGAKFSLWYPHLRRHACQTALEDIIDSAVIGTSYSICLDKTAMRLKNMVDELSSSTLLVRGRNRLHENNLAVCQRKAQRIELGHFKIKARLGQDIAVKENIR